MNCSKRVLLITDSRREHICPSEALGDYMLGCLHRRGFQTVKVRVNNHLKSRESTDTFLTLVKDSPVIIISCAVHDDGLSEFIIRDMRLISDYLERNSDSAGKKFLAILNYDYLDVHRRDALTSQFRRFARECGLEWIGCLNLGMARIIRGKSLDELSFIARNIKKALGIAAEAIAEGNPLSGEAVYLMEKPIIPTWLYTSLLKTSYKSGNRNGVRLHKFTNDSIKI